MSSSHSLISTELMNNSGKNYRIIEFENTLHEKILKAKAGEGLQILTYLNTFVCPEERFRLVLEENQERHLYENGDELFIGKLAIHLLDENTLLTQDEKETMRAYFHIIMLLACPDPLDKPIALDDILKNYPAPLSNVSYNNLVNAVECVNSTRSIIKHSDTHPGLNYSPHLRSSVSQTIEDMRNEVDNTPPNIHQDDDEIQITLKHLEIKTRFIKKTLAGNCYEASVLALEEFHKIDPTQNLQIVQLQPGNHPYSGDHVLLVVGAEGNDWREWQNAVFIDAWSREIYFGYELETCLKNFTYYLYDNQTFNTVSYCSPEFRQLEIICHVPGNSITPHILSLNNSEEKLSSPTSEAHPSKFINKIHHISGLFSPQPHATNGVNLNFAQQSLKK